MPKLIRHQTHRRKFVIASLIFAGSVMSGCLTKPASAPARILFVCQAGTAKSAIARELLKQRAKEQGIVVDVYSRGIMVEDHLSPHLKANLKADGIDTNAEPATQLIPSDWAASDILVIFNPLPDRVNHQDVRDWTDVPSVNDDYKNARKIMDTRIEALLAEIINRRRR